MAARDSTALSRRWAGARTAGKAVGWNVILPSTMAGEESEIIRAVLNGAVDRYAELVERYQEPAIRLAFSFLGHYEDARDVSQDAFVSAYQSLGRFRRAARFSTWLYRIVVNKCKDARRRKARQPMAVARVGARGDDDDPDTGLFVVDVPDPGAGAGDQLAAKELSRQVSLAIAGLPMSQRTAFLLHHVHGLPLEEAAGVMGCRIGTVKSHVFRATAALRQRLAPGLKKETT